MNPFVGEFKRYKSLLEKAIAQVPDEALFNTLSPNGNSIAIIWKHLSGNFRSRFTDFLTSDGEKEWRNRDSEFIADQSLQKSDLKDMWDNAWQILEESVFSLSSKDMKRQVTIRGVTFTVEEALARSLAHFSYHVGQIVFLAKYFTGDQWKYLSIPPGKSDEYNQNPNREKER
ncbi:MAG: DUF1572 domain-containing protein [Calditrichaeota bacterium]|nr:MAG: DUF1572 domain-containing protein [Calditrichota bacterium]